MYLNIPKTLIGALLCAIGLSAAFAGQRAELDGIWLLVAAGNPDDPGLTPAGQAAFDRYDPLRDDTDLDCIPVSFTNLMHTPSPPIEIRQHEDHVEINYEYHDVRRRVPLDPALALDSAPYTVPGYPHLGRSVGRYEGETLLVDTAGQHAGYLDTGSQGVAGLPQSDQMRTEERFVPDGDRLRVVVTHHDPVNYTGPMVMTYDYGRIDTEIMEWGCTLEGANYDDRLDRQSDNRNQR